MKVFGTILMCLAFFIAGILTFGVLNIEANQKPQFEYKVEYGVNEKKFNEFGKEGWELATCGIAAPTSNVTFCIFKRAK